MDRAVAPSDRPVAIALGSNLGDRRAAMAFALDRLSRILLNPRLSDIVDFPRKCFTYFNFLGRASWLLLALEACFWRVTGTIVGTIDAERLLIASARVTMSGSMAP